MLWFNGIRRLPAAAPPLLGLAAPVTGAVLGWVVLGQSLSPVQLTGFVVTLGAIAYGATLPARPHAHQRQPAARGSTTFADRPQSLVGPGQVGGLRLCGVLEASAGIGRSPEGGTAGPS